jgi:type II restriction/modification system DNA methylase subunit YeeA
MDRTKLKNYAPKARREFIEAMTERAAFYGLNADKTEPLVEKGDVAVIGGRSFSIAVARKRKSLEDRIKRYGFQQTMEAMAYTWFNRLVAIRYMELHGYLDHGYRVLSHPDGKPTPEILEHAEHVELPGLKKDRVIDLKLAGNKESELYRLLLTAQCNALHSAMPFLFERIDDETELLLPDNLLNSDSLIRKLVKEIDEADWQEVEIIGWLYQFYISEKNDEVIGKVVASENIPAATQLFTPNWIVKYLVQNTLGRQWLATYPVSPIRQQMEYYIEPAEQTIEVQEQLKAITPNNLNPEELTLLDPACGSGHILVEAYDLFKAIYQERGYRAKDIPALILQKNLFGLEIDDRAAQLAAFALMMKARADDRRIFDSDAKPNIVAIQESKGGPKEAEEIAYAICGDESANAELHNAICQVHALFENGKTFGSLIQVPPTLAAKLPEIEKRLHESRIHGDLTSTSTFVLRPILQQARLLARQYDAVVANPPYMGARYQESSLRRFLAKEYSGYEQDLFSAFMIRGLSFAKFDRHLGFMSPFVWMFIPTHEQLRSRLLTKETVTTLIQLEYSGFDGATVPICTFTLRHGHIANEIGCYIKLSEFRGAENQGPRTLEAIRNRNCGWFFQTSQDELTRIPGSPLAFWIGDGIRRVFKQGTLLGALVDARQGMATANNDIYIRRWAEVAITKSYNSAKSRDEASKSGAKWFPYNKGGVYRKWYGNHEFLVNWENDGSDLFAFRPRSVIRNPDYYFLPSISWSDITSGPAAFRSYEHGFIHDVTGMSAFNFNRVDKFLLLAYCNTPIVISIARALNPTLHFQIGDFVGIPFIVDVSKVIGGRASEIAITLVNIAKEDWDSFERSWNFHSSPLINQASKDESTLDASYDAWITMNQNRIAEVKKLEEENNNLFIQAYDLSKDLKAQVSVEQVTLTVNPSYRYGGNLSCEEQCIRFRQDSMMELISYAIGGMLGRYSLDKPGLIYAHSGNQNFDPSQYKTFRADDDGIIPLLETDWGIRDDATDRFEEFVSVAWPKEYLDENLRFVADSLGPSSGEQPRETIRRYLASGFYKHHLSMYKKRPIYWLFSSGKLRAFQCLVYLHRYNEGTLARIRTEYVIPLQGQIAARIEQLEGDKAKATSTSHRNKIQKEQDKLKKQQVELASFEEKLKHYADMRISLDLDDGVKVHYAKFGDLLAESKAITGGKDDD